MSTTTVASHVTASTQFIQVGPATYAYRRFGAGPGLPLLFLQHFTGTLDNWDPTVTGPLASGREVILFDNAGIGRSTGTMPESVAGMATHTLAFLDGLGLETCDVLGFSFGGNGRAAYGAGTTIGVQANDPRRDSSSRRRGDHAPAEAWPGPILQ